MAGFGPGGIVAGSIAAFLHSMVGNVASGSAIALLQSIGRQFKMWNTGNRSGVQCENVLKA